MSPDFTPDPNLARVAGIACELGQRIREEDTRRMFDHLMHLCHRHPAKAAQLIMVFCAWFDPDAPISVLGDRAEAITAAVYA